MDIGVDIDGVAVEVAPMIEGTEVEVGREKVVTGAEIEREVWRGTTAPGTTTTTMTTTTSHRGGWRTGEADIDNIVIEYILGIINFLKIFKIFKTTVRLLLFAENVRVERRDGRQ